MSSFQSLCNEWNKHLKPFTRSYQIGPFTVAFSSTDSLIGTKLLRAFEHLPKGSSPPDLTIRLWSGPKLPNLDWNQIQTNGYRGYAAPPIYLHYFEEIQALSAIDVEQNIAYYAIRDPEALPWWVSGSPFQVIFHVWLRERGIQLTHSASISNKKKAILLAGKGGSGKSTTVLACMKEGLNTLGEDYVLLAPNRIYNIYQTAKWLPHTRTFFPSYEDHIANPQTADQEKALIHYKDLFPSQLEISASIHAIVSLSIGSSLKLEKSSSQKALQNLLLSTAKQLPLPDPRTTFLIEEFVKPLPHYQLSLGPDLKANVALLKSLLE